MAQANYGIYGSSGFFVLLALIVLATLVVAAIFESVRLWFIIIAVITLAILLFVTVIFVRNRYGIVPYLTAAGKVGPNSLVLDVGTGRGFPPIEIAKAVPGSRVIGIDLWGQPAEGEIHQGFVIGNTRENAVRNAIVEGVQDRVTFQQADAHHLLFEPEIFDTIVSFMAMHQMVDFGSQRELVPKEIHRVLKKVAG
jgi:SAM-dependent methyltransferase